jgi:hypothetical protein
LNVPRRRRTERAQLLAQIAMSLCNIQAVRFWWSASTSRLYARTMRRPAEDAFKPTRGRGGAVPADSVLVGEYEHERVNSRGQVIKTSATQVLSDLEDLLAGLVATPGAKPTPAPLDTSVATPRPIPETTLKWAKTPRNFQFQVKGNRK